VVEIIVAEFFVQFAFPVEQKLFLGHDVMLDGSAGPQVDDLCGIFEVMRKLRES
jgi:hypothetical protein